jgi:hypothetical protein
VRLIGIEISRPNNLGYLTEGKNNLNEVTDSSSLPSDMNLLSAESVIVLPLFI